MKKLAILASNPVPYHAPLYKRLALIPDITITVLYFDEIGLKKVVSEEFNQNIQWDIPLLEGYNFTFLKNYSKKNRVSGFLSRINFGIIGALLKGHYDAVLIQGYDNFSNWLALLSCKLFGIKIIWRGEATLYGRKDNGVFNGMVKFFSLRIFFSCCNVFLYSCSGNKEYILHYGVSKNKLYSFPCSVDNEFFISEKNKLNSILIRKLHSIAPDDFVVLMTGRITQRKRPKDLLNALNLLNNNKIVALYVGDGLDREILEQTANEIGVRAIFNGFINQSQISTYYSIANCITVLSEYDPSPKVLNEAMLFSLPVIVTDVVGTANDLVFDGQNGFIIKTGDIKTLASKVNYLFENPLDCIRMGQRSFEIVTNWNFDEDAKGFSEAAAGLFEKGIL